MVIRRAKTGAPAPRNSGRIPATPHRVARRRQTGPRGPRRRGSRCSCREGSHHLFVHGTNVSGDNANVDCWDRRQVAVGEGPAGPVLVEVAPLLGVGQHVVPMEHPLVCRRAMVIGPTPRMNSSQPPSSSPWGASKSQSRIEVAGWCWSRCPCPRATADMSAARSICERLRTVKCSGPSVADQCC